MTESFAAAIVEPASALPLIRRARERLAGQVHRTPIVASRTLAARAGSTLVLKCENLQRGGAFKVRGALNKAASLPEGSRSRGLITYSSGNHAQGVAIAAQVLGTRAVVVMPEDATASKSEACRGYGAEVIFAGLTSEDRRVAAERIAAERGLAMIPPFDDPEIVSGQGTVGLELLEDGPQDLAAVFVPIGGGGLISGVALAVKALTPRTRVIGVEPVAAAKAHASLAAGTRVRLERIDTIADGLRPLALGELTWEVIRRHVDEVVTVEEAEIVQAMRLVMERMKMVVEPSGAVSIAAGLVHAKRFGSSVAVVSGGNLDIGPALESMYRRA